MKNDDEAKRSLRMSRIKSNNTSIELIVRKWLFSFGYRYRVNDKRYPGKPDIILPKYKTAIFVHGCFWHGHNCKIGHIPKTNTNYWKNKIGRNQERDRENASKLHKLGWNVITIWECEIKNDAELRLIPLLGEISGEPLD